MPGHKETAPTRGAASSSASAGYHSDPTQFNDPGNDSLTLEELERLNNHAAGLHFPNDLVQAVHLRSEARDRATERQRRDARAAVKRTPPNRLTETEIEVQRETARLYKRLIRLTAAGKIRWDAHKSDWVKRPVLTRTDSTRPPAYTTEEILDRFDKVRRNGRGWTGRCPAHNDKRPSLAITEGDKGWLLKCWAGCTFTEIVHAADLKPSRMFYR